MRKVLAGLILSFVVIGAQATAILCSDTSKNHMYIDSSQVSACMKSGTGNLTGNPSNDLFINSAQGVGYLLASKSDTANPFNITYSQTAKTWGFDASFWATHADGAIAFKFGTGNKPDEWFVYQLKDGVSSGAWNFVNVFGRGGGLSHVNLYSSKARVVVAEPTPLMLLMLGLFATAVVRTRKA